MSNGQPDSSFSLNYAQALVGGCAGPLSPGMSERFAAAVKKVRRRKHHAPPTDSFST